MITLDEALADVQSSASDTTSSTQTNIITWLNQGYQQLLANFGRPNMEKTVNTTTNTPSSPLAFADRTYALPPDYLFVKTVKIQIGSRWYDLVEEESQEMWDFATQYNWSGIPARFFVKQNFGVGSAELQIDPICATASAPMTIVYETTDVKLDHLGISPTPAYSFMTTQAGTMTFTQGSKTVTCNQSVFSSWMALGSTYLTTGDDGDGQWYKITAVNSNTSVTLGQFYQGVTVASGTNWQISQMVGLPVDMQDIPEFWALYKFYQFKKDMKWRDYYKNEFYQRLGLAKNNWATKSRSSIIRSKKGMSRWNTYPGWFPPLGASS